MASDDSRKNGSADFSSELRSAFSESLPTARQLAQTAALLSRMIAVAGLVYVAATTLNVSWRPPLRLAASGLVALDVEIVIFMVKRLRRMVRRPSLTVVTRTDAERALEERLAREIDQTQASPIGTRGGFDEFREELRTLISTFDETNEAEPSPRHLENGEWDPTLIETIISEFRRLSEGETLSSPQDSSDTLAEHKSDPLETVRLAVLNEAALSTTDPQTRQLFEAFRDGLKRARRAAGASLALCGLATLVLLAGVVVAIVQIWRGTPAATSAVTALGGAVTAALSALMQRQATSSMRHLESLIVAIRDDTRTNRAQRLSLLLTERLTDSTEADRLRVILATRFADGAVAPITLNGTVKPSESRPSSLGRTKKKARSKPIDGNRPAEKV